MSSSSAPWIVAAATVVLSACASAGPLSARDPLLERARGGMPSRLDMTLTSVSRVPRETRTFVCVDLSLDAGLALADRVLADARAGREGVDVESRTVELANRMRQTLTYLRESMARLCEQWLAGRTPVGSRLAEYEVLVETTGHLAHPTLAAGSPTYERCEER